eukprot:CAMPEP_0178419584 /NCGR_PEP_ID=MMETSP0689_2-20121128/25687_1 /TAXON_ID=160604 /ORGANISM="Amphidinium massartii, Strain CS-259" /LENGTH=659 /DNA_ID=CAMNT_0020041029 /DNA_START=187 /DNA_END=2163 /DNA_ORIENTATION=+
MTTASTVSSPSSESSTTSTSKSTESTSTTTSSSTTTATSTSTATTVTSTTSTSTSTSTTCRESVKAEVREEGIVGYAFFLVVNGEDSFSDFHLNDSVAFVQKESADAFDRQVVDPFTSCGCPETLYTVTVDFALPDGMGEEDTAILMVVPVTSDQETLPLGVGTLPLRDLTSTSTSTSTSSFTSTSSATSSTSTSTESTGSSVSSTSTSESSRSSTSSGSTRFSQSSTTSSSTSESTPSTSSTSTSMSSTSSSNTKSTTSSSSTTSGSSTEPTSSTSTTTSSTTTEQPIAAQVVLEVSARVDDCEEYAQDLQVHEALATALADAAGIPVEWVLVSIVCINNAETRRLAVAAEEANVLISYIIEVPTDATSEDFNVTSTNTSGNLSNSDDFDNQDAQDVTLSIASAIAQLSNEELEDAIRIAQADRGITQQLTVTAVEDPVIIVKTSTSTSTSSPSSSSTSESSSSTAVSSTVASSTEQHSAGSSSSPQAALSTTAQIPGSSSTGSEIATTTDADAASSASSRSSASSASSISSSMSTVTTSSTQQPVLATLYFVVRITVANVDAFTSDAAAVQALRRAVADFLGLPVGFVRVELNVLRRLAQSLSEASSRLRHLTTSSSEVDLNFAVAIPQENDLGKTATEAANDAAATVSGTTAAELT